MTIFDLIISRELQVYYEDVYAKSRAPYITEELWDVNQKLGTDLKWLLSSANAPKILKNSAYDVAAIPRKRIGMQVQSADMPFFKESMYIDEELRQQLNIILETGNQSLIETIVKNIYDDEMQLVEGAAVVRERMRTMLLSSGIIALENNGQVYSYDYRMPDNHKVTVKKSWSDPEADILSDIDTGIQQIQADTGVTVSRAICSSKVLGYMRNNKAIKGTLLALSQGQGVVTTSRILEYMLTEYGLDLVVDDQRFVDTNDNVQRYIEDDLFIMFPEGTLGTLWYGTTPEQSDLLSGSVANVSIVDTGVAVTTMRKLDPVNVETKVTQICLPTFPKVKQVYVMDVNAASMV